MHLIILTFLLGAKLNYESCMAKPKLTQNGEIWTTTVKKCLLGRFCEVMIWKRFYFINLRFLHFLVYATKSKRLPQPLETQNKSIILLFFAFLGVIFSERIFYQGFGGVCPSLERNSRHCWWAVTGRGCWYIWLCERLGTNKQTLSRISQLHLWTLWLADNQSMG